jgi:hypothetical protein
LLVVSENTMNGITLVDNIYCICIIVNYTYNYTYLIAGYLGNTVKLTELGRGDFT